MACQELSKEDVLGASCGRRWLTGRLRLVGILGFFMMSGRNRCAGLATKVLLTCILASAFATAQTVGASAASMTDLGTLPGGTYSGGPAINALGQVTGQAGTASGTNHAFRWTASGGMQDLGTLGGASEGVAINTLGQVTGDSYTGTGATSGDTHAFRWTPSGGMQDLGTLPGRTYSEGDAINDLDQVTGQAGVVLNVDRHAFRSTPSRGMQDLGTLGGADSVGNGINDLGQVAGYADTADGHTHAFRWTASGGMRIWARSAERIAGGTRSTCWARSRGTPRR